MASSDAGDSLSLSEDGSPSALVFERPRNVLGHAEVRALRLDEHGEVCDMSIGDATVDVHGVIRYRRLAAPAIIDGVACAVYAAFDSTGRLESTTLAEDLVTPHGILPVGSLVTFHADGSVDGAQIGGPCVLAGQTFERHDPAHFCGDTVVKEGWVFYTP